ncbi:uncharacterized protein BDZ99DRAFT_446506 [Mytilinidion resinicola]|uniref:DNA polymerase epsilon subunit B n=1 Tax=Mytilinidion resinicola TaxID=574789 RepID=A0A6A6YGH3_9PEZI|nr:uncharacterized protein BDZ99DRAFT_446506 [Mytilinidion resinicola]KAF2807699.1 hypothetical protein BDZ99DRAFT_446506 [Mytilinidion resinicola]
MATTNRRLDEPSALPESTPNPIPSSSPAFATPAHPILPRRTAPIPAPPALKAAPPKPTILPILLPPATLRPLAFRTFTKKHNLTLTSSALQALATFIGRHCGSGWREEGLAERVLEEVAKSWKKGGGQVIVDGDGAALKAILKAIEGSMSGGRIVQSSHSALSRQGSLVFGPDVNVEDSAATRPPLGHNESFGISRLEVEDPQEEEEAYKDARDWIQVVGAFEQPRLVYSVNKKHFEKSTSTPSLFPQPSHKTDLFRHHFHIVHQRILRNDTFQAPSFSANRSASLARTSSLSTSQTTTITPIANLLGRTGSTHLLLGLLTVSPTGTLALSDLTGSIALDLQHARPIPEDGTYFAPGMIVLVDGTYEEDYSNPTSNSALGNTGGIGGNIGGKFIGFSVGHPPCERRSTTLGSTSDQDANQASTTTGPAFGWTDFLGLGSERATGARMSRLANRLLPTTSTHNIAIASDLHLDVPSTLSSLRTLLKTYTPHPTDTHPNYPLAIVLMGNFSSRASLAGVPGAGSIEYKEHFDALAAVLAEFPELIAHTTLVLVPGDNDAWPSAFSAGASAPLPRKAVPTIFTSRIRRVVAEANREIWGTGGAKTGEKWKEGKRKEGEVVWTTNPSRLSWFGVKGEMVLFRDDVLGRLSRTAIRFGNAKEQEEQVASPTAEPGEDDTQPMDLDPPILRDQLEPLDPDTLTARALTRTLLSQSHLSPFPLSTRPLHWDYASALSLYPLPSALVVADKEAPAFVVKYSGCTVMNPGPISEEVGRGRGHGKARWVEFDVGSGRGLARNEG